MRIVGRALFSDAVIVALGLAIAGCSSGSSASIDASVPATTAAPAAASTRPAPTASTTAATLPSTVPPATVSAPPAEPVVPAEFANVAPSVDGKVSWNISPAPESLESRRFVIGGLPDGFAPSGRYESAVAGPESRVVSAFLATGTPVDPLVSISVTTPAEGAPATDLSNVKGEPASIAGRDARRYKPSVAAVGIAFAVDERRIDIVVPSDAEDLLLPVAEAFSVSGDTATVVPPAGSGLRFVGAYSPRPPASTGETPIGLFVSASVTQVAYTHVDGRRAQLAVTTGRVSNHDALVPWLDSRSEQTVVAGKSGWLTRITQANVTSFEFTADGRAFLVQGEGVSDDELAAMVASVSAASADEWDAIPPSG